MGAGRRLSTARVGPPPERVLQEGAGRRIVPEAGGLTARKTFTTGPRAERERTAADELSRLSRFSAALADVPGATCPRPLGGVDDRGPGCGVSWVGGGGAR